MPGLREVVGTVSPRITVERQASNLRIAQLRVAITDAVARTLKADPDLTRAEVLCALGLVSEWYLNRLLADDDPEPDTGPAGAAPLGCGCG